MPEEPFSICRLRFKICIPTRFYPANPRGNLGVEGVRHKLQYFGCYENLQISSTRQPLALESIYYLMGRKTWQK